MIKRLNIVEEMVRLMEMRVQPWVYKRLKEQSRKIQRRLDGFELRITH